MRVCALCDESLGDGGLHEHLSAKHNISQAQYEKLAAVKLGTMLGKGAKCLLPVVHIRERFFFRRLQRQFHHEPQRKHRQ